MGPRTNDQNVGDDIPKIARCLIAINVRQFDRYVSKSKQEKQIFMDFATVSSSGNDLTFKNDQNGRLDG